MFTFLVSGGWDFGDLGWGDFGKGWDPMMMMMDLVRFYSSRGFVERCVGWMREKGGFSFSFIGGGDRKRSCVSK